jgi:2-oxoglutarate dehydrogenase E2 component (dihydrolipoamide succinyltransferase)
MTNDSAELVDVLAPEFAEYAVFVQRWLARLGDTVQEDDELVEVMVDKAEFTLCAPATGVLAEIIVGEKSEAESGDVIGRIRPAPSAGA